MREHGHAPPPDEFLRALSAWAILQARLPLRKGGLGLTSAVDTSPVAYLGGQAVCAQFLHHQVGASLPYTGEQYAAILAESRNRKVTLPASSVTFSLEINTQRNREGG